MLMHFFSFSANMLIDMFIEVKRRVSWYKNVNKRLGTRIIFYSNVGPLIALERQQNLFSVDHFQQLELFTVTTGWLLPRCRDTLAWHICWYELSPCKMFTATNCSFKKIVWVLFLCTTVMERIFFCLLVLLTAAPETLVLLHPVRKESWKGSQAKEFEKVEKKHATILSILQTLEEHGEKW